ncbi:MAG: polysaccharide deacetylase family protein [Proteobacteria bacterium]|nr:polysaccharide deacetylase family protein [Pseudomonadota bacterium]
MEPRDYGPFPYLPITNRPRITWPNGAWLAVWVIPNLEFFPLRIGLAPHPHRPKGPTPSVREWAQRDYGNRVGVWRLMEVFTRHGIRASATLNSDLLDHHPEIVREGMRLGWEFLGHNKTNSVFLNEVRPEDERTLISEALARIAAFTGKKPVGWLGSGLSETWNTLDYLADEGLLYIADWVNDDQPYLMDIGGKRLCSIPYSYEINDSPFLYHRYGSMDDFTSMIRRQFDVLYDEGKRSGRVMAICLHPWLVGVSHRFRQLDEALGYVCGHDRVWLATGEEIVRHYLASGVTF